MVYYQRKRSEGKSHASALRALANQWIRIIYAAWVAHRCYDVQIFLAAQKVHTSQVA